MAEDRAQEALDHLQNAALELISALRAVLDVAEEAVREPKALRDLVTAAARAATHAATEAATQATGQTAGGAQAGGNGGGNGVEHIRIS